MRIWVQCGGIVNEGLLLAAGHQLTHDRGHADLTIWVTDLPQTPWNRAVLVYSEPPLDDAYATPYAHPEQLHTCFLFGTPSAPAFEITTDPVVYPYQPDTIADLWRESTKLQTRKIFFAGTRIGFPRGRDMHGRVGLYETRSQLVIDLRACGLNVQAEGIGWERESRRAANWDLHKRWMARGCGADFHLCCENSMLRNYITEKLHHGFQSDLCVLYLGNPDIHRYVPPGAFVNLNLYYNPATRRVDAAAVAERVYTMTQEEYTSIIMTAREWRRSDYLEERRMAQIDRLTRIVLARI